MSDSERFKYAEKPILMCIYCKERFTYSGVIQKIPHQEEMLCGLVCPSVSCYRALPCYSIIAQLMVISRSFIQKYYDAYLECDEPTCKYRTRKMPLNVGHRCLMLGCQGIMHMEVRCVYFHNAWLVSHHSVCLLTYGFCLVF